MLPWALARGTGFSGQRTVFASCGRSRRSRPTLCVEIDNSAAVTRGLSEKLADYRSMGVTEVVYFAPEAKPGERLRVWDRIDDDLVERVVEGDTTRCVTLGLHWITRAIENAPVALRLAEDAGGNVLVLDRTEAALARVAELETELKRRG